jgi:restriction system protein
MAMIKFYECFKEVLICLSDGKSRKMVEICEFVAKRKNLSEEERNMKLEKSGQGVFYNRIGWARTYLKMAGLVYYPEYAFVQITDEGKKVLAENPEEIDVKYLSRYESFREFQKRSQRDTKSRVDNDVAEENQIEQPPEELIENAFLQINKQLANEILDEIFKLPPTLFEKLTLRLLNKMGYGGSGAVTKMSGDGGIDVIISEDKLGLRNIYIQAKRYALDSSVGRPEIQGFVGAIANKDGKGVFITTAKFSEPAKQCAKENHIVLIDGDRLAALMIEYDVGVSTMQTYEIKRMDSDFFTGLDF